MIAQWLYFDMTSLLMLPLFKLCTNAYWDSRIVFNFTISVYLLYFFLSCEILMIQRVVTHVTVLHYLNWKQKQTHLCKIMIISSKYFISEVSLKSFVPPISFRITAATAISHNLFLTSGWDIALLTGQRVWKKWKKNKRKNLTLC